MPFLSLVFILNLAVDTGLPCYSESVSVDRKVIKHTFQTASCPLPCSHLHLDHIVCLHLIAAVDTELLDHKRI